MKKFWNVSRKYLFCMLFVLGIFIVLGVNLTEISGQIEEQCQINVFVPHNATDAQFKAVGEKLAKIAKNTQILAVSHLAQIAVMSDAEFLIEKQETQGKTITCVHALSEKEKMKDEGAAQA